VHTAGGRAASLLISVATALAIVAVTLPLFLNPAWVAFEQGRAQASAWTGYPEPDLRTATDAILADLVLGPPDFDVEVGGVPVLSGRERSHMRDVRSVFIGFFAVAVVLVVAALVVAIRRRSHARVESWRAVRGGALGLVVVLVALGGAALIAFDVLFEIFHRIFFAGGTYLFDPSTERLVQLFPFAFWQETAIAVGVVCIALAAVVALVSTMRIAALTTGQGPAEPRAEAPPVRSEAAR
jgi:integral membrane protein (TIGR01906 family)